MYKTFESIFKFKLYTISDNKKNTDGRDDAQVDKNDPREVEQVHSNFPQLSHDQVKEAIEKAGPWRKDIYEYVNKHHK